MESGKYSLETLQNAGVFHVPEYQRYYSWEEPEWEDLWKDLRTLPENKSHYFGTIIFQKTEDEVSGHQTTGRRAKTKKQVNLLIDGQQRLTSLILLTKSITEHLRDIAPKVEHTELVEEDVSKMGEALLVEDNIHFLKLLDERDSDFLKRIISGQELHNPQRQSQRRLKEAKEYFDHHIDQMQDKLSPSELDGQLSHLWKTILELELMVYVIESDSPEKATLIFDSVNDRGRDLSTLDKTKSFLMRMAYLSASDQGEVTQTIGDIRRDFGKMYDHHQQMVESSYVDDLDDDAVQRYHFITFFDWTKREDHSDPTFLDKFKRHVRDLFESDQNDGQDRCIEYLKEYTESLEAAFRQLGEILSYGEDDRTADLIDRIHKLRHATKFYPLLIKAWSSLDQTAKARLLKAIETYILRVYAIGNHPTYTGRSSVFRIARDVPADAPIDKWLSELRSVMSDHEDDNQFRRTLASPDMYSSVASKDLRYLFYFYNRERAKQEGERGSITLDEAMGSDYEIEHIWPQEPDKIPLSNSGNYRSVTERYDAYKHRLGNLTLASEVWNAKWGNKDFETKTKEGYRHSKLWVQSDLKDKYDQWSVENIESREEEITEFALEKWPSPRP